MNIGITGRGVECQGAFEIDLIGNLPKIELVPTYEYECQKCQHRYDLFQSIKDAPKKTCPKCKGRVKRLFSTGGGLLFKGSGFYITDYRKPGYKEAAKKDSTASTPAPATPTPSSDAGKTPAKKPVSKD
ncbi:MAG: FmdB family zinc ribbon protein [Verrucomicrobiota bacterium]